MKSYTAYCKDEDGFIEEIDIKADDYYEARRKAKKEIKDNYCDSLKIVEIVSHKGTWF